MTDEFSETDLAWFKHPLSEPTLAQEATTGGIGWHITFQLLWTAIIWVLIGVALTSCQGT